MNFTSMTDKIVNNNGKHEFHGIIGGELHNNKCVKRV